MDKESTFKIGVIITITIIIIIFLSYLVLVSPGSSGISANEFYDDLIDRNNDGVIEIEDCPLDWKSYSINDVVRVRDKIKNIHCTNNQTIIQIGEYAGKYELRSERLEYNVHLILIGDRTGEYSIGDWITVQTTIVESVGYQGEGYTFWTLVE